MLERELAGTARATAPARQAPPAPSEVPSPPPGRAGERRGRDRRRETAEPGAPAERELVRVLLHDPARFEEVMEYVGPENFRNDALRAIFSAMAEHGADASAEVLAADLEPASVALLQTLLGEAGGLEFVDQTVRGALRAIGERRLRERLHQIDREFGLADDAQQTELTREKMRLVDELRRLGGRGWKLFQ
jgi:hypothetical protein